VGKEILLEKYENQEVMRSCQFGHTSIPVDFSRNQNMNNNYGAFENHPTTADPGAICLSTYRPIYGQ
jgi:hypothetical protein